MKRVLALIAVLTACGVPPETDAAVGTSGPEIWYVRPATQCAFNGDGLSYGCAASPGASGAFNIFSGIIWTTTTGVDNDDTLYVCGAHHNELRIIGAGAVGLPVIARGDCPGDPGTIDSSVLLSNTADAIRIEGPSHVTVMNFSLLKGSRSGVMVFSTAPATGFRITGVTVDQRSAATTTNPCHGISFAGTAASSYTDSIISGNKILGTKAVCANEFNDGIHIERAASNFLVTDNDIANSMGGIDTSGTSTANYVIARNRIHNIRGIGLRNEGSLGCMAGMSITGNEIINPGQWGIDIEDVANSFIANNTVVMMKKDSSSAQPPYGALIMQDSGFSCPQNGNTYLNNLLVANYIDGVVTNYNHTRANFQSLNTWNGNLMRQSGPNTAVIKFLADPSNHVTIGNFSTWQASHLKDSVADPLFVNPVRDHRLKALSPARHAGVAYHGCLDVRGRNCNWPPDLGAYAVTSGDLSLPRDIRQ